MTSDPPMLFYPPEPCAACARECWTCCPVCRGPYCLSCIAGHAGTVDRDPGPTARVPA